ncbi:hypothetical protein MBLNU230_g7157t1 [Neophaeotheca triangularis]
MALMTNAAEDAELAPKSPNVSPELPQQAPRQVRHSLAREALIITVLCSTELFVQGCYGYILIPLPIVGQTFNQSTSKMPELAWHVSAYSLTAGTFILPAGRLGDIYGSKKLLILGWVWFAVWGLIGGCAAFTASPIFFDIARAFQGIGPAILLPNSLAIAGRIYPPGMRKNIVFSIYALTAPLGCCVGGLIASAFAQYVWWPWVMWVYCAGCGVVALTSWLVLPPDERNMTLPLQTFDFLGALLGVAGLLLLNASWIQAPIDGWDPPYVYVLLILGFVFLGLFVAQERRAKQPILDLSIFNRDSYMVLASTGLGWASFSVWFYYLFQFLQRIRSVSALESAVQFIPGALSGIAAAICTAWMLRSMTPAWLMVLACFAFLAGCLLLATAPVKQSYWHNIFWSFIIEAWGMDISFPASATILSNSVPREHQGVSASVVNTVVNYSIAIGIGIAGTVEVYVGQNDLLAGYRAAMWVSVGLGGCAVAFSLWYAVMGFLAQKDSGSK